MFDTSKKKPTFRIRTAQAKIWHHFFPALKIRKRKQQQITPHHGDLIDTEMTRGSKLQRLNFKSTKHQKPHLEDHPRTRKWLTTMVRKSPKDRVGLDPFQMAIHGLYVRVTNYLLTGMIQIPC